MKKLTFIAVAFIAVASAAACHPSAPEPGTAGETGDGGLRSTTTFRQWHGERNLDTKVELVGGSLRVVPGRRDELYRMASTYDGGGAMTDGRYDPESATLSIGTRADSMGIAFGSTGMKINGRDDDDPSLSTTLALSPEADAALSLNAMAMQVDAELGGLRVASLAVNTVAGQTTVRFSRLNGIACDEATMNTGLSEVTLIGLGNSRCRKITVTGIAGQVSLDFSGDLPANMAMKTTIIAGSLELRLPRNVGVRLTQRNKLFTNIAPEGLRRDGETFVSPDYERATRRLEIDVTTMIGSISVEWIGE